MGTKIKEIDTYIARSAAFAKPILKHIRELVHEACPQAEEKMKWSFPHFDYKNEMMCSMAGFKQHCVMSFWKAALIKDRALLEMARSEEAMGHLGRITSIKDLPPGKKLIGYIKEAMRLNDEGIKLPAKPKADKKEIETPEYFLKELLKNKAALKAFENFSYSHRKEYILWISEAKTEPTRNKRMETAIEWLAESKGRNWQYEKKDN